MKSDSASARAAILALLKTRQCGPHLAAELLHMGQNRVLRECYALEKAGLVKSVKCIDGKMRYALLIDALRIEAEREIVVAKRNAERAEAARLWKRQRYIPKSDDDEDYLPVKRSIVPAGSAPPPTTTAPRSVWELA